jgi:hypothetical protein
MNRIVCVSTCCDEKFWIDDPFLTVLDVVDRHRVHVMDKNATSTDVVTLDAQVTGQIANDDFSPSVLPLGRCVEQLIHPPIEAKRSSTDKSFQCQVIESIFE